MPLTTETVSQVSLTMRNIEIALDEARSIDMRRIPKPMRHVVLDTRTRLQESIKDLHALQTA